MHTNEPTRSKPNLRFLQRTISTVVKTNQDKMRRPRNADSYERELKGNSIKKPCDKASCEYVRSKRKECSQKRFKEKKEKRKNSKHSSPDRRHKRKKSCKHSRSKEKPSHRKLKD